MILIIPAAVVALALSFILMVLGAVIDDFKTDSPAARVYLLMGFAVGLLIFATGYFTGAL
jgi:hypothetical protein